MVTSKNYLLECRYTLMYGTVFTQTSFRKLSKWSAAVHVGIPICIRRGWRYKKYISSTPSGLEWNYGFHFTGVHEIYKRLHVNTLNGISLTPFKKCGCCRQKCIALRIFVLLCVVIRHLPILYAEKLRCRLVFNESLNTKTSGKSQHHI